MVKKYLIPSIFVFLVVMNGYAQHNALEESENSHGTNKTEHEEKGYLRVALLIGHSLVALDEGGHHSPIGSWGFDIEYWISHRFGLGFHNDFEFLNYVITRNDGDELDRHYPIVVTADVMYRPFKNLILFGGIGKEIEKNESFLLSRLGIEYEISFAEHWDLCPTIYYDTRKDAFNTYSIMLGVGRIF